MTFAQKMVTFFVVVILGVAIYGGYEYPKASLNMLAGSPIGATFTTQKAPAITFSPTTGTSTAILNNTGQDQYIVRSQITCQGIGTSRTAFTGTGLATWTLTVATSSTGTGVVPTTNPLTLNFVIPTSTPLFTIASSTLDTASSTAGYWPAGSYLMFGFNATNTATCTLGVQTQSS